jgi:hypothetical protein
MKKEVAAMVLVIMIFLSTFLIRLPLVSAAYTVEYPYMPPDLVGDVNNDGVVELMDYLLLSYAYGSQHGDPNWDPRCDVNNDGIVDLMDFYIVSEHFGDSEDSPVAYSTTFDFTVPNDGDEEVWHYVLARVYVPLELSGEGFYLFPDQIDDWIRNVKIDGQLKYSGGHSACQPPANVSLGVLGQGYHILEFEFGEQWGYGELQFHVATASGQPAWLARFRVYVPNYSDVEYGYKVTTRTWTTMKDDYFLIGYADDFMDDVHVDGLVWADWMWDMGEYGTIYAWEDGFCYPLGNLENNTGLNAYSINFTFGEWSAGLLDFQYVSWTLQQEKIGEPKFFCKAENPVVLAGPLQIDSCEIYGGSKWDAEAGTSWRSVSTTYEMTVYLPPDGQDPNGHGATTRFTISLLYLDYESPKGTTTDFAMAFNMTHLGTPGAIPDPLSPMEVGFEIPNSGDFGIYVYAPEQALLIQYLEHSEGRSFVDDNFVVNLASDVSYVLFAACVGTSLEFGATLLAALAAGRTLATMAKYTGGQQLPHSGEIGSDPTYRRLWTDGYLNIPEYDHPPLIPGPGSRSDMLFLQIKSGNGMHCGAMKIAIVFKLFFWDLGTYPIKVGYPVKITTTFIVPYFIKN